ncbi:MAG: hypothetical protein M0Z66_09305 [Thermaerobacter sp.]|nr:hypothetical protein [Thermaerobacter sp.]
MDARDERLEQRLQGLGEAIDREIGPVDTDAGWRRLQARRSAAPQRGRPSRRPGWWVGAAAALAAILIAAPYVLHLQPGKPPVIQPPPATTKPGGVSVPIGKVSAVDFLSRQEGFAAVSLGGYGSQNAVLSTANGGQTWLVHKLPQGYSVLSMHFTDDQLGYVLAQQTGTTPSPNPPPIVILWTRNGGQTWTQTYSAPGSQALMNTTETMRVGFQFYGSQGYAFVGDKILTTTGGKSWSALSLPQGFAPVHMDFLSPRVGYVAGQECPQAPQPGTSEAGCKAVLIETTDGGQTWSTVFTAPQQNLWAYSDAVSFANGQDGWFFLKDSATWQSYLYQTKDGGKTWTEEQKNFAQGRTVAGAPTFVTPKVGWLPINEGAAPYPGGLLITRDGGQTWSQVGTKRGWSLNGVSMVSAQDGFAAGNNATQQGFLIKTTNGGQTWTQVLPSLAPTSFVDFPGAKHGFGIGIPSDTQAFLATSNGGKTWSETTRLPANAMGLSFVNANLGYAIAAPKNAGTTMQVLRSTDGGQHWQVEANLSAAAGNLFATTPYVKFFDAQHGILETEDYPQVVLEATSDGGKTWTKVSTQQSVPGSWQQISFLSPQMGYAISTTINQGQATVVMQETTDGGTSWSTVKQFTNGDWAEAMYFQSPELGWLAMRSAPTSQNPATVIMQTTDGGKTWSSYPMPGAALQPIGNNLLMQFQDQKNGSLMGQGSFYRTTDGGRTWMQQP